MSTYGMLLPSGKWTTFDLEKPLEDQASGEDLAFAKRLVDALNRLPHLPESERGQFLYEPAPPCLPE